MPPTLGRRLRRAREQAGVTQATVAKRARVTREYVNKLEAGRANPSVRVLQRLAKALGVPVAELIE